MSLLLVGSLLLAALTGGDRLPTADTRAGIVAGYRLVLAANDHDGDGRLNRPEWTAMVSTTFPEQPRETPPPDKHPQVRDSVLAFYAEQDRNHDGYLDLRELIREPLAQFACADSNRDGRISERERWRAMIHCASHAVRFGFISEPTAGPPAR
jgi:hypothetical protein